MGNAPGTDLLNPLILYMVHVQDGGEEEMNVTSGTSEHG